jgi:hypothetical protein
VHPRGKGVAAHWKVVIGAPGDGFGGLADAAGVDSASGFAAPRL